MSDATAPPATRRMRWAVALLIVGLVVAFVPALVTGEQFLGVTHAWFDNGSGSRCMWMESTARGFFSRSYLSVYGTPGTSAIDLVRSEVGWRVIATTLAFVPALFGWWRHADVTFARIAGIGCAVAASESVVALVASMRALSNLPDGLWWTVPAGGALMAAAFVVAPAPRRRDE